jgi:hypothetical protein
MRTNGAKNINERTNDANIILTLNGKTNVPSKIGTVWVTGFKNRYL